MLARILAGITGAGMQGAGAAISEVVRTVKGDATAREANIHGEQMAVLEQFAAEFAGRPPKTWWDSLVDGLNRLPRPIITFSIIGIFLWALVDPVGFVIYMDAMHVVPDELWLMWLTIVAFWFGGRLVSHDLRKPKITKEQIELATKLAKARLEAPCPPGTEQPATVPTPDLPAPAEANPPIASVPVTARALDAMLDALLVREGGFANHPKDRGGPTNMGVTQATLEAWRGQPVSIEDVKALTRSEATEIYRARYYFGPGIDRLPAALQEHVFDIAVNSGPVTAIRLLQRALNSLGAGLREDGAMGPATVAAARARPSADIHRALVAERLRYLEAVVENDPSQGEFINQWRQRARQFLI